jgi:hypothetical protein
MPALVFVMVHSAAPGFAYAVKAIVGLFRFLFIAFAPSFQWSSS